MVPDLEQRDRPRGVEQRLLLGLRVAVNRIEEAQKQGQFRRTRRGDARGVSSDERASFARR